jgi:hypothetical protein
MDTSFEYLGCRVEIRETKKHLNSPKGFSVSIEGGPEMPFTSMAIAHDIATSMIAHVTSRLNNPWN